MPDNFGYITCEINQQRYLYRAYAEVSFCSVTTYQPRHAMFSDVELYNNNSNTCNNNNKTVISKRYKLCDGGGVRMYVAEAMGVCVWVGVLQ